MNALSTMRLRQRLVACFLVVTACSGISQRGHAADPAAERYAGIEVGAKGIKAIVLEISPSGVKNLMEQISNTTLAQGVVQSGSFAEGAIADTAEEAGKFAQKIRDEFHVSDDKVSVIGSSGLPKASNREALVKAVAAATKLRDMTFISPTEEVRYTIKGLFTDPVDRASALLIDVGSGNTKGGFLKGDGLVDFVIPFGSVTFENRVAADATKDKKPFGETAAELRTSQLEPALVKQVSTHPELLDRKIIVLSGGAVYAMASLLKPADAAKKQLELSTKDIAEYAALVRKAPITSPAIEAAKGTPGEKDIKNVLDNFKPTNLVAGAEILTALAETLKLEGKTIRFERSAIMALVRGKVLEFAEPKKTTIVDDATIKQIVPTPAIVPVTISTTPAAVTPVVMPTAAPPVVAPVAPTPAAPATESLPKHLKAPTKSLPG